MDEGGEWVSNHVPEQLNNKTCCSNTSPSIPSTTRDLLSFERQIQFIQHIN